MLLETKHSVGLRTYLEKWWNCEVNSRHIRGYFSLLIFPSLLFELFLLIHFNFPSEAEKNYIRDYSLFEHFCKSVFDTLPYPCQHFYKIGIGHHTETLKILLLMATIKTLNKMPNLAVFINFL